MRWKPRIDYLLDVDRPPGPWRWRFAILEVAGRPYGKPIPFTTLREVVREAWFLYHREAGSGRGRGANGPGESDGADKAVLLLVEDLRPLSKGPMSGIVALHCPEDGCRRFLREVNWDTPADPVLPVWHKHRIVGAVGSWRPMRFPPGEWPDFNRLMQSADYFTVHTVCPRCKTRAEWDLPRTTSWVRYRRTG
jgi:hypothetical protein